jgi:hypothetical protein
MGDVPVKRLNPFAAMPKCLARNRRGGLCQRVAGPKGRCRLHGGAWGSGGPWGDENGRYRHGRSTHTAKAKRAAVDRLLRELRAALATALATDDLLFGDDPFDDDGRLRIEAPVDRRAALAAALDVLLPAARADALADLLRRSKS